MQPLLIAVFTTVLSGNLVSNLPGFTWATIQWTEIKDDASWFDPAEPQCVRPQTDGIYDLLVNITFSGTNVTPQGDVMIQVRKGNDPDDLLMTFRNVRRPFAPVYTRMRFKSFVDAGSCLSVRATHTDPSQVYSVVYSSFKVEKQ